MKLLAATAVLGLFVVLGSGCRVGDGHGGGGMTEAQCKEFNVHMYQLSGATPESYASYVDASAKLCAEKDALSQKDYDCGMKAKTLDEFKACNIVIDLR